MNLSIEQIVNLNTFKEELFNVTGRIELPENPLNTLKNYCTVRFLYENSDLVINSHKFDFMRVICCGDIIDLVNDELTINSSYRDRYLNKLFTEEKVLGKWDLVFNLSRELCNLYYSDAEMDSSYLQWISRLKHHCCSMNYLYECSDISHPDPFVRYNVGENNLTVFFFVQDNKVEIVSKNIEPTERVLNHLSAYHSSSMKISDVRKVIESISLIY